MRDKIKELGSGKVSKHCVLLEEYKKRNIIDVAPSSIIAAIKQLPEYSQAPNKELFIQNYQKKFVEALEAVTKLGKIEKFIGPPKDPAYHLVIPQLEPLNRNDQA